MGFIREYDPYTHRSQYNLFTPEECNRLSKILLRDERMVLSIPNNQQSSYSGTTHQFPVYNWLNNPDLEIFDIPKRLFTLPEFQARRGTICSMLGQYTTTRGEYTNTLPRGRDTYRIQQLLRIKHIHIRTRRNWYTLQRHLRA